MSEESKDGLIRGFILDGHGGARVISLEEASSWSPSQGVLWLHFDYSRFPARKWLKQHSGIPASLVKTLIDSETRPRWLPGEEGSFLSLRGVNLNPGNEPEDMVSVRLWLEPSRIISTRKRKVLSIKDISRSFEKGEGPSTVGEFIVRLNEKLIYRMREIFENIQSKVDALEVAMLTDDSESLRSEITEIRRGVILLRRYLSPQRDALMELCETPPSWVSEENLLHLRESFDKIERYLEDLDAAFDRAGNVHEELSHRLTEQLNRRMYVLSVVTLVFMPITFVTGAFGMNLQGIPGADSIYGFMYVLGLICLIGILILAVLYRKKWI